MKKDIQKAAILAQEYVDSVSNATLALENGKKDECLKHLKNLEFNMRLLLMTITKGEQHSNENHLTKSTCH